MQTRTTRTKPSLFLKGFTPQHFTSVKPYRVLDALGALLILGAIALLLSLHAHKASRPRPL